MNVEYVLPALSWSLSSVQEAGRFTTALRLIIATDINAGNTVYPDWLQFLKSVSPGTFSSSEGLGPCLPCAKCPSSVPMLASCSATQDTQCECDNGFFFLGTHGLCAPCSKCNRGEGIIRECGPQGNTQCQICGPGTFSEELRSTKPCQTCTKCSDSEVEIRACMPNSDALCMGELVRKTEKEHCIFIGQDWWYSVFVLLLRKTHEKTHNNNKLIPLRLI